MRMFDLFASLKFAVCRSRFEKIAEDYTTNFLTNKTRNECLVIIFSVDNKFLVEEARN